MDRERVLLVEDDAALQALLVEELNEAHYTVATAASVESAWAYIRREPPELIISDLRLAGSNGMDLLTRSRTLAEAPCFIIITAFGTVSQAVEALKQGADDFLTKPLDLDHFLLAVRRVLETRRLRSEVRRYRSMLGDGDFHGMIGRSASMHGLFETISQVARAGGPVLVLGESGVGKELVARAIHRESDRSEYPFVAVNCAGIPPDLMESELFGHAAGAFTGAQRMRRGLFAESDGGILLLDEIAEMALEMQAKLLRVLQDGRVRPVGANREEQFDVRIIAATNRNLEREVRAGRFREDLFFRLETFSVEVPPLRERGDDLDLLAAHFVNRFAARLEQPAPTLSPAAVDLLHRYRFPGNVRELANAMERAVTFCRQASIQPDHLPRRLHNPLSSREDEAHGFLQGLDEEGALPPLAEVERRYIEHVVERVGGNKRRAAALLGIGRRTLYRRLSDGED